MSFVPAHRDHPFAFRRIPTQVALRALCTRPVCGGGLATNPPFCSFAKTQPPRGVKSGGTFRSRAGPEVAWPSHTSDRSTGSTASCASRATASGSDQLRACLYASTVAPFTSSHQGLDVAGPATVQRRAAPASAARVASSRRTARCTTRGLPSR